MKKTPFITLDKAQEIIRQIPTPFHLYDEAGIRRNARALKAAFSWNKGFREYFAVKATPNPYILKVLHEERDGVEARCRKERQLARKNELFRQMRALEKRIEEMERDEIAS